MTGGTRFARKMLTNVGMVAGVGMLLAGRAAIGAGMRRRDGWRRAAGMVLRGPAAGFVLSAFGLDVWHGGARAATGNTEEARARLALRLRGFLDGEAAFHVRVEHGRHVDRVVGHGGPSYSLAVEPALDGARRYVPPEEWGGEACDGCAGIDPAGLLFNFVCRVDERGRADVWVRVNHVGADGVPVQEMMNRLEGAWGGSRGVIYPTPEEFAPFEVVRECPGRAGLGQVQAFIDFGPLLAWRKRENARLPEPMTLAAAILWRLAGQERFRSVRMGTTVDVPEIAGLGRGVGVVVLRPSDFFERRGGLAEYVRAFNRQVELNRRRLAGGCRTLDAAAFVPAGLARALIRHALRREKAFGTLGLTMLRDAKVFGTPIGDLGHRDGFIAVGSVGLPTAHGAVGCVTIKGPRAEVGGYPAMVRAEVGGVETGSC